MMNHTLVSRSNLQRPDIACFFKSNAEDEVSIDIRTVWSKRVRFGDAQDEIRLAELPSFRELRDLRQIPRAALRLTLIDPVLDQANLFVGKPAFAGEFAESRLRHPRWHVAAFR